MILMTQIDHKCFMSTDCFNYKCFSNFSAKPRFTLLLLILKVQYITTTNIQRLSIKLF